ncbi:hypothetical protein [Nocardia arizonensis]|uniref:hypothetical protein n=1 Tax=Nocardia arizonensis TaxID=1141647 RepID=UPI0006D03383|nr:hypothetical protein [Nocardia arizonensis]
MPNFVSDAVATAGLYRWVGEQLERLHARPDPRAAQGTVEPAIPRQLARFRERLPVTVPAWLLDGHSARSAGFFGVVPDDRHFRASAYVVGPDDTVMEDGA